LKIREDNFYKLDGYDLRKFKNLNTFHVYNDYYIDEVNLKVANPAEMTMIINEDYRGHYIEFDMPPFDFVYNLKIKTIIIEH